MAYADSEREDVDGERDSSSTNMVTYTNNSRDRWSREVGVKPLKTRRTLQPVRKLFEEMTCAINRLRSV